MRKVKALINYRVDEMGKFLETRLLPKLGRFLWRLECLMVSQIETKLFLKKVKINIELRPCQIYRFH